MHYIAFEGLIEDKRRELAAEALKPRPKPLSDFTPEAIRGFATQLAKGFNRTQYAALKDFRPRDELLGLHELLSQLAGDVLSAQGMDGLAQVTAVFLVAAGIPYTLGEPNFKALVFEFATALDTEYIKPSTRRLHGREAVPPPPLPVAPQSAVVARKQLTLGMVIERHQKALKQTGYTRKVVRCLTLFREMVGANTPVESIRQLHVTDFLRNICSLPSDWARRFDSGTATIPAMLAEDTEEVMSPLTYTDNYRAPLKAFLRDSRRDYGDEGFPSLIVDGIEYSGDRVAGEEKQRALSVPELKTFFEGHTFEAMAASTCALADWQPFETTGSAAIQYMVGAVKKADGNLVLVEYKRMAVQLTPQGAVKPQGLIVSDQFVAGCREGTRGLVVLLKLNSSVHQDAGGNLRALDHKKYDPPQEVSRDDKEATTLATKVCGVTPL